MNMTISSQVGLRCADEGGEFTLILALDILNSQDGGGLLVNDRTKTSLALHDDIGNTHLAAQGRKEDDELDGVDIMGDDDKRGLLRLDEGDAVVQTVLDEQGLLRVLQPLVNARQHFSDVNESHLRLSRLLLSGCLGKSIDTSFLLLLSLWAIPVGVRQDPIG